MKTLVISLLSIVFINNTFGQLTLDLAKTKPGEKFNQTIEPQAINSIVLENTLVDYDVKYSINIEEKRIPVLPFVLDEIPGMNRVQCKETNQFSELEKQINSEKNETNIPDLRDKLSNLIKKADKNICAIEITNAQNVINKTKRFCPLTQPINLEKGEQLTITISRDTLTWIFAYSTSTENPWSILYGFTYVLNWPNRTDSYFAKADTGNTYLITKQNSQINSNKIFKNISPTIMFTWKPIKKYNLCDKFFKGIFSNNLYQLGITGGISLDLSNPSAMISPSLIFSDNLSISFGAVFTQNDILNGKYSPDERIAENLSYDQLHEKRYGPKGFVSISFRFDKNIFQKANNTEDKK